MGPELWACLRTLCTSLSLALSMLDRVVSASSIMRTCTQSTGLLGKSCLLSYSTELKKLLCLQRQAIGYAHTKQLEPLRLPCSP